MISLLAALVLSQATVRATCPTGYCVTSLTNRFTVTCSRCASDATTSYVLPTPTASTLGGVMSKTCSGTDKLSAIGLDGLPVCSTDTGGAGAGGLPADPAACPASQWVIDQNASGVLTCSQPGWTDIASKPSVFTPDAHTHPATDLTATGRTASNYLRGDNTWGDPPGTYSYTLPDATAGVKGGLFLTGDLGGTAASPTVPDLASRSGTGACGASTWASTLNGAAAPTCTQPGWTDIASKPSTFAPVDATAGVTGGVRLTGDFGGTATSPTVPGLSSKAATVTCGANTWASTLGAGASSCTQPAFSNISGSATLAQLPTGTGVLKSAGAAPTYTTVDLSADTAATALPITKGGAGVTSRAANDVVVGTGANATATKVIPSCSNASTSKLLYDNATQTFSCGTDQTTGGMTITRLAATWASSATANTLGIVGTGGTPLTSPTYGAAAPFSFTCWVSTARPATTNGPRYGITSSGTVTTITIKAQVGLAAATETQTKITALTSGTCTTGCSSAMTTGTVVQNMLDTIEGVGVMNASGTLSLQMAPSAAAANTAQIGSYCIWY